MLTENFIAIYVYIKKKKISQIDNLTLDFGELEKEQPSKEGNSKD